METATETQPTNLPAAVNGTAVAVAQPSNPLPMPVSPAFVIARYDAIQEIVRGVFQDGTHYGVIPGTGTKKTLLKPGFDALCTAFQFAPDFVKQPESIERADFVNLVYKCVLTSATGRVVATGIGSCNSKEEKYRWTTMARKCPLCKMEAIIKGKTEYGGGWVCFGRKGGCNAKFKDGDPVIEGQPVGRIENDNAWNFHNTITKMAQKRAGMAAIITACGISGDFTQDVDDFDQPPAKRPEDTIDIQANADASWRARAAADDRVYTEDIPHGHGADRPPEDWREQVSEAAQHTEDADFRPAPPREEIDPETNQPYPKGIAGARAYVRGEIVKCKTVADLDALSKLMEKTAGAYSSAKVIVLVTEAREALKLKGK